MAQTPRDDRRDEAHTTVCVLEAALALTAACEMGAVLRVAVEVACRLTGSRHGLAVRCRDGEAGEQERYAAGAGWVPQSRRRRPEGARSGDGWTQTVLGGEAATALGGPQAVEAFEGEAAHVAAVPLAPAEVSPCLVAVGRDHAYAGADLRTLTALGRLVTLRLDEVNGRRRCITESCAAQADIADRLQRKLLPQEPPHLDGLDVAFSYRSASTGVFSGGDFVDFYSRSPGALAFAIGDVAGKGVDAMAVTFVTKYVLRAAVQGGQLSWPTHPGEALQELRTALLEQPDFVGDYERFVTVLFGTLSISRGLLQLASAGHPPPFIVRADRVERPLLLTEPAVGVELGAALMPYPQETIRLQRGDVCVFFTDGLTELRDTAGGFFEDALPAVLQGCHDLPAEEVVERLLRAGDAFAARPQADDLAVLCIHLTAAAAVH